MFSASFKRLYYVCDRVLIRNLRGRRLDIAANPGVQNTIDAFENEGFKIKQEDVEEYVERSESDFHRVGNIYPQYRKERQASKEKLRHKIIKEKYFKENLPNLLTWSEREQIRHLNETDPDEWTPEKIEQSFPVTASVVKKLLKYAWKPATKERIARHDASAMRNWKELKEGTLEIPEDLKQHFLKFSERTIPPLETKSLKFDVTPDKDLGEFERIIHRCATNTQQRSQENQEGDNSTAELADHKSKEKVHKSGKKAVTLDELTARIKKRINKGTDVDIPDQIIVNTVGSNVENSNQQLSKEIEIFNEEIEGNALTQYKEKDTKVTEIKDYPLRIRIPKKAYKKGATYKVDDCYYDHDGKFLYRVIGMSN